MHETRLRICEIFNAFQGEGSRIGEPVTIFRLFGCNLDCSWCDTRYSINRARWEEEMGVNEKPFSTWTVDELVEKASTRCVLVTGGEPLLQRKALGPFLTHLIEHGHDVTVETNGTFTPYGLPDVSQSQVLWSVSPKLASAGQGPIDLGVLRQFVSDAEHVQLKFVIDGVDDFTEALHVLSQIWMQKLESIVFQPNGERARNALGGTIYVAYFDAMRQLETLVAATTSLCNDQPSVRVLPQLHLLLHGGARLK